MFVGRLLQNCSSFSVFIQLYLYVNARHMEKSACFTLMFLFISPIRMYDRVVRIFSQRSSVWCNLYTKFRAV